MTTDGISQRVAARVPAVAEAIVDLLNSRAYAIHSDALDTPDTASRILHPFDATEAATSMSRLDHVRALRSDLMTVVGAKDLAGAAQGWADFTARTSGVTFQQDFSTAGQVRLRQVAGDQVIGRIALDVAELVNTGAWSRIRSCANGVCGKVFYDTTRSRTQRWHSYEICGNRNNVAAYRARTAHPAK